MAFTCQHGEEECNGNKAQACAINAIQNGEAADKVQQLTVALVGCAMSSRFPPSSVPQVIDLLCCWRTNWRTNIHRSLIIIHATGSQGASFSRNWKWRTEQPVRLVIRELKASVSVAKISSGQERNWNLKVPSNRNFETHGSNDLSVRQEGRIKGADPNEHWRMH